MAKQPVVVPSDILAEASAIVHGPRQEQYGEPLENWAITAEIMSALTGRTIKPEEAVLFAISLKLARLRHDPSHRDSQVDLAGYAWVLSKVTA